MKYLFDTNVLVDHLRGTHPIPNLVVSSKPAVSIITIGELYYGAEKSNNHEQTLILLDELFSQLNLVVLPLDFDTIRLFAFHKSELEKKGARIEDFDLLIGSTALSNDLTLVSRNVKHFKRIKGLKVKSLI